MERHLGYHICAIPVGGIEPAFGHHPLRGEVNHKLGLHPIDQVQQRVEMTVEIDDLKAEIFRSGQGYASTSCDQR